MNQPKPGHPQDYRELSIQSDSRLLPKNYRRLSSGLVIATHNLSGIVTR